MSKTKRSLVVLITLFLLVSFCFVTNITNNKYKASATGEQIVISDDFRTEKTFDAVEKSHVAGAGNATYGLVPYETWGGTGKTGNGYLVYKVSAETGHVLENVTIEYEAGFGHGGGLYWWNQAAHGGQNKRGVNLEILVSNNNKDWTPVYDADKAGKNTVRTQELLDPTTKDTVDLTANKGNGDLYVKVALEHFTPEEAKKGWTSVALAKLGLKLMNVKITATQKMVGSVMVIEDDFRTEKTFDAIEKSHVAGVGNATWGLVPYETWGGAGKPGDGYLVYKVSAESGYDLNEVSIYYEAGFSHGGGLYWWNEAAQGGQNKRGVNLEILVSNNNKDWKPVYDADIAGKNTVRTQGNLDSTTKDTVDLTTNKGNGDLYIKVFIDHFTVEEINKGQSQVALTNLGLKLMNIKITATQKPATVESFIMVKGASARVKENSNGIRFMSVISKGMVDRLNKDYGENNIEYGTVILPSDYISTHGAVTEENLKNVYTFNNAEEGKVNIAYVDCKINLSGDNYEIKGSLININVINIERDFVGVGVITIKSSGVIKYIVADYFENNIKNNSRSVYQVAQSAIEDPTVSQDVKDILQKEYIDKVSK